MSREEKQAWQHAYMRSDAYPAYVQSIKDAMAARPTFTAELAEDGTFRFEEVDLAWHQLSVSIMHPAAEDGATHYHARGYAMHQFIIRDADGPHDLGTLTLELKNVVMPGDIAPDWTATTYDGGEVKLSDFRGRYVLVDFWATWCAPCKAEIPNLEAVYEDFGGEDFAMIGLSIDETIDLPEAYHEENPSAYMHGFLGLGDSYAPVRVAYGIRGIPSIWLIGPDGIVVARDLRGEALREAVRLAVEGEAEGDSDDEGETDG